MKKPPPLWGGFFPSDVIPAQAGIQLAFSSVLRTRIWIPDVDIRRSADAPPDLGDDGMVVILNSACNDYWNNSLTKMVSSRSGLVEMTAAGTPIRASRRRTYFTAFSGRSASWRTPCS